MYPPCHPLSLPVALPPSALSPWRWGAGSWQRPFDEFNLGNARAADGDDSAVVARNRAELIERAGLPSPLRWLRQVHGTRVLRFGAGAGAEPHPHTSPPLDGEGARAEIGSASCRERGCQYVEISVAADSLKKQQV